VGVQANIIMKMEVVTEERVKPTGVHILHVKDDDDMLYHPESCPVTISTNPIFDHGTSRQSYDCTVTEEIRAVGWDSMFPNTRDEGWYLLTPWWEAEDSWGVGVELLVTVPQKDWLDDEQ
jgi:hypothetical protein